MTAERKNNEKKPCDEYKLLFLRIFMGGMMSHDDRLFSESAWGVHANETGLRLRMHPQKTTQAGE